MISVSIFYSKYFDHPVWKDITFDFNHYSRETKNQLLFWQSQIKILSRINTSYSHNWSFCCTHLSPWVTVCLYTLIWWWFQDIQETFSTIQETFWWSTEYSNFFIFCKECLGSTLISHLLISLWCISPLGESSKSKSKYSQQLQPLPNQDFKTSKMGGKTV